MMMPKKSLQEMPHQLSEQQVADYLNASVAFVRQQVQAGELACADQPGGPILNRHEVLGGRCRFWA